MTADRAPLSDMQVSFFLRRGPNYGSIGELDWAGLPVASKPERRVDLSRKPTVRRVCSIPVGRALRRQHQDDYQGDQRKEKAENRPPDGVAALAFGDVVDPDHDHDPENEPKQSAYNTADCRSNHESKP